MARTAGARRNRTPATRASAEPTQELPRAPMAAMQFVAAAHDEVHAAFTRLVAEPADSRFRLALQRDYREKATRLLALLRSHNDSGLAPTPWNLTLVAQPL